MKNLAILIFALLFTQITAFSQPCLPQGITFSSQEEIDNFQTNYPNCTEIEGDVEISGADITNLNGLSVLTAFGGDLLIGDVDGYPYSANPLLNNLTGLDNVTSIGGDLDIRGNDVLTSITGLLNVTSIGGYLRISYNDALISLTGLDNVTSIGGFLWIFFNNALTNLTGLDGFTSIGGSLRIYGNDALISLTGLNNLISIGDYLEIQYNDALTSLIGLDNVTSIGGYLEITGNDVLSSLTGLNNLISIGEYLDINHNNSLINLTGLDGLTSIGGYLEITGNDVLTSLTGLNNLISIGGYLEIRNNNNLTSLSGIDNIETGSISDIEITGNSSLSSCDIQSLCDYLASPNGVVEIENNAIGCNNPWEIANACGYMLPCLPYGNYIFTNQTDIDNFGDYCDCTELEGSVEINGDYITNLNGLNVLTHIGGGLYISGHENLSSLSGLENITSIGGNLELGYMTYYGPVGNPSLTSLTGLDNLTSIGGDLQITGNENLVSLAGLENLTSVGGNLIIGHGWTGYATGGNPSLASLTGLANVTFVGGELRIYRNEALTSLIGINIVTSIAGLHIVANDSLSDLTGLEGLTSVGGELELRGNAAMKSLIGLEGLTSIGGQLGIYDNAVLSSITGLENLTIIEGGLNVGIMGWGVPGIGNPLLTSLAGLDNVTSIGGVLDINNNAVLTSLAGLDNVASVGGSLNINSNDSLISLMGLENITSIGGDLDICDNESLSSLTGLNNLTSIGSRLGISGNEILPNLTSLGSVTSIGGSLEIGSNDSLTSLAGLDNVQAETIGDLIIINNSSLSTCEVNSVCGYLSSPNGTIEIHDNAPGCNSQQEVEDNCFTCLPEGITFSTQAQIDSFQINYPYCSNILGDVTISGEDIVNLNGMNNVTSIGGGLYIIGNPVITDLWGLANIDPVSIEELYIVNNASLSVCDIQSICDYLASPSGTVNIQNNAPGCNNTIEVYQNCNHHCLPEGISLTSQVEIDSFQINYPDCADIDGALWIYGNTISNLNGLNNLTSIGGKLRMINNGSLTSLNGLNNISYIGGNLEILNNDALSSLSGLDNLTFISSMLKVEHNHSLTNLAGLDNLNTIGGTLKIYHNDALISLEGLNNVNAIGGYLKIMAHEVLTSLSGLENVSAGSIHGLIINNNSSLATCAVESICHYLADPGGIIEIQNNASGCNNPEEVIETCWSSIDETAYDDKFLIFPNPLVSGATIKYILHQSSPVTLKILDLSGRLVVSLVNEVQQQGEQRIDFNTTGLPAGIYFCVLKTCNGIQTRKIVKL